jgi:hypothetical protein
MSEVCKHCGQANNAGETVCGLCKKPLFIDEVDNILPPPPPPASRLPTGILAIIVCAVISVSIGAVGVVSYLRNLDTPESVALDGLTVLLHAGVEEFAANHAFAETGIYLAQRSAIVSSREDAFTRLIPAEYSKLENVIETLRESDIELSVTDCTELTETRKNAELTGIINAIVGDSNANTEGAETINNIADSVTSVYRVIIGVSATDTEALPNVSVTVHVGMIDGKWLILS